jgi:excisionase family DNA binding protein
MATQTPAEKAVAQGRGVVARFSATPEEQIRLARFYVRHFSSSAPAGPLHLIGPTGEAEEVPTELYSVLREVLQHLKDGQGISLIPSDTLLTTQQAAQLLNVSRPYLYKLINAGEIPFEQVGTHRRLKLRDLEGLRERRRVETRQALDSIAALDDGNHDYFDDYGEIARE